MKYFEERMLGMYAKWSEAQISFLELEKVYKQKKANNFWKKIIVMTKFPDNSLT